MQPNQDFTESVFRHFRFDISKDSAFMLILITILIMKRGHTPSLESLETIHLYRNLCKCDKHLGRLFEPNFEICL